MSKKLFLFIIGCVLFLQVRAEKLYFENATINPGATIDLPILIQNEMDDVAGFQFHLTLPDGITVLSARLSENRLPPEGTVNDFLYDRNTIDGVFRFAGALNVTKDHGKLPFTGDDGEVALLTIQASDDIALGTYTMVVDAVVITNHLGSAEGTRHIDGCTFELTVEEKVYDEGYAITVDPFKFDQDIERSIYLTNATDLTNIDFDIVINPVFVENDLYFTEAVFNKREFTTSEETKTNGSHISINRRSSNKVAAGEGTEILTLELFYEESVPEGIYTIRIENIYLTDVDGNEFESAPYTTDFYVGNPMAVADDRGVVAFHGNYSSDENLALLTQSLSGVELNTMNLLAVTALPEGTSFHFGNPNVLILTSEDLHLGNENNVVIGQECQQLVITDGYPFSNVKEFSAVSATYSRMMNNHSWGTLCLPFEVMNNETAQIYSMMDVTTDSDGVMTFDKVESASANTPCIIKKLVQEGVTFTSENVIVPISPKGELKIDTAVDGWSLIGTLSELNFTLAETPRNLYMINSDAFWLAKNTLRVPAFRAFFETSGSAPAKFRIQEDTNGIEVLSNDEKETPVYDLQGHVVKTMQSQHLYIRDCRKVIFK